MTKSSQSTATVVVDGIPQALRETPRWLVWAWGQRDGKFTKTPYSAHDVWQHASSTNADTWGTFEEAVTAYEAQARPLSGLGFVLSADDDLAGIDFDHCRDPETGKIAPWAQEEIDRLDSYTEISPSGNGLHVLVHAVLPGTGHKVGLVGTQYADGAAIEIYDRGRYFTVTGHRVGAVAEPQERQGAVDALLQRLDLASPGASSGNGHDLGGEPDWTPEAVLHAPLTEAEHEQVEKLCGRLAKRKKPPYAHLLWVGKWQDVVDARGKRRFPSASEADFAFLCMLLEEHPTISDRVLYGVWRRSGLWRDHTVQLQYVRRTLYMARQVTEAAGPEQTLVIGGYKTNDNGNALRLVEQVFGNDVRYVVNSAEASPHMAWLVWDGGRFQPDIDRKVVQLGRTLTDLMLREIEASDLGPRAYDRACRFAVQSGDVRRIREALNLASSDPRIQVRHEHLDQHPDVLNFSNGTLELRLRPGTGLERFQFREARRDDLLTQSTGFAYDPAAVSPVWDDTLRRFIPDDELRETALTILGSSLYGDVKRFIVLMLGGTNTGKSTTTETVAINLGDYGCVRDSDTFLRQRNETSEDGERPQPLKLSLVGKRFVAAKEVNRGARANMAQLRAMTGGDTQTARQMYQGAVISFKPTWLLVWAVNSLPHIEVGDDEDPSDPAHANWERILVLEFNEYIPYQQRDPAIFEELTEPTRSGAAVINTLLQGLLRYLEADRKLPKTETIQAAIDKAKREVDPLRVWMEEAIESDDEQRRRVSLKTLTEHAGHWCRQHRTHVPHAREVAAALRRQGYTSVKGERGAVYFTGLVLSEEGEVIIGVPTLFGRS